MPDAACSAASIPPWSSTVRQQPDLDQVFARYMDPVYRFIYTRVGNREDAEDLTSEVFVKATRQLDSQRAEASIAQWLFTVARTVLADHWRRYYRIGTSLPLDDARVGDLAEDQEATPSVAAGSSALVAHLLGALPERYRRVLQLRFLQGYSIQETADELGITPENVKVIQHRALAKAVQIGEGLL